MIVCWVVETIAPSPKFHILLIIGLEDVEVSVNKTDRGTMPDKGLPEKMACGVGQIVGIVVTIVVGIVVVEVVGRVVGPPVTDGGTKDAVNISVWVDPPV